MQIRHFESNRWLLARLDHNAEIIDQISDLAKREAIGSASFSVIGALIQADLAIYDQSLLEYKKIIIQGPVEIVSCFGNISCKDDKPFVHAHAILADKRGNLKGGHLMKGQIFAAELSIQELAGQPMVRKWDLITGLYLWGES